MTDHTDFESSPDAYQVKLDSFEGPLDLLLHLIRKNEVNIYDKRPDPTYRTGGIVDVAKPMAMITTGGKWNTIDITARRAQPR